MVKYEGELLYKNKNISEFYQGGGYQEARWPTQYSKKILRWGIKEY